MKVVVAGEGVMNWGVGRWVVSWLVGWGLLGCWGGGGVGEVGREGGYLMGFVEGDDAAAAVAVFEEEGEGDVEEDAGGGFVDEGAAEVDDC